MRYFLLTALALYAPYAACSSNGQDLVDEVRPSAAEEISRGPAFSGRVVTTSNNLELVYVMDGDFRQVLEHYERELAQRGFETFHFADSTGASFYDPEKRICLSVQMWGEGLIKSSTLEATKSLVEGHPGSFWVSYSEQCDPDG
jgi:hypothetical protein